MNTATAEQFEFVAHVADVPEESLLGVTLSTGTLVCLINHGGSIHAVSDKCSHQAFPLSEGAVMPDGSIQCAWHGARFDCATGAARRLPAEDPVPVYAVRVDQGRIFVGPRQS